MKPSLLIDIEMDEVSKIRSRIRVAFGLRKVIGPKEFEKSQPLRELSAVSPVLVYRTTSKRREGPFTFISVDGETVVLKKRKGRRIFRSACVQQFVRSQPRTFTRKGDSLIERGSEPGSHAGNGVYGQKKDYCDGTNGLTIK